MNDFKTIFSFYATPVVAAGLLIGVGLPIQEAHDRKIENSLQAFREGRGIITCHYPGRALPGSAGYDVKNIPVADTRPMAEPVAQYFEERIRSSECAITGLEEPERRPLPEGFGYSHAPGGAG